MRCTSTAWLFLWFELLIPSEKVLSIFYILDAGSGRPRYDHDFVSVFRCCNYSEVVVSRHVEWLYADLSVY